MEVYQTFDFLQKYNRSSLFWNNEFESRFREQLVSPKYLPLKVFVVPFSHNDAGWVKTFQQYYEHKTRHILNNIVTKLPQLDDMSFVWSEISFLAEWWTSTDMQARTDFLDLIKTGKLEILTGGWVMPDEAVTHYFALLTQLTEGHQWLQNHLGIKPRTGWAIDPFGHSTTMPYLLSLSGIKDGIVIQRVHYAWKRYFAKEKSGDFIWRQRWDANGENDLLTHHQPFEIYSACRSCGPHREVCQEYDFYYVNNLTKITFKNIRERLEVLLSEYGRSGSLFDHNVVLVTLGDDFRFTEESEWYDQYSNYKALMDYLSSIESYKAEIQFGTPLDYFKEVQRRQTRVVHKNYPILKGDFFPYADVDNKVGPVYWTGFYSTRPYWKSLSRKTEANLRSAEILFTLALNFMKQNNLPYRSLVHLYKKLISARKLLSIFQHHDGITGTSKHVVMNDYLTMLLESNINSLAIQSRSIQNMVFNKNIKSKSIKINSIPTILIPTTIFTSLNNNQLNIEIKMIEKYPRTIIVFNPLASWREEVVRLTISSPTVIVRDHQNNVILHQINPIWYSKNENKTSKDDDDECNTPDSSGNNYGNSSGNNNNTFNNVTNGNTSNNNNNNNNSNSSSSNNSFNANTTKDKSTLKLNISKSKFEITFIAVMPPLTLKVYKIELKKCDKVSEKDKTRIITMTDPCDTNEETMTFTFKFDKFNRTDSDIKLRNKNLIVRVDTKTGYLKGIINRNNNTSFDSKQYYRMYKSTKHRSGAYLFKPEYEQISLNFKNIFVVMISGKILTEFIVIYNEMITQIYRLYHTNGPLSRILHIENLVDIKKTPLTANIELALRFKTGIDNGNPPTFYTDSNGYQMQKRVVVPSVGVEGNYYPITTTIYIEDSQHRFTILTRQSHGATSNCKGSIEIMLDRRVSCDDNKGMGEGVMDNELTSFNFWLLLEDIAEEKSQMKENVPRMTLLADYLSDSLIYPINIFISNFFINPSYFTGEVNLISNPLPCGVHLVNIRTLSHHQIERYPLSNALLTIQRKGSSPATQSATPKRNDSEVTVKSANVVSETELYFKCKFVPENTMQVFHDKTTFGNLSFNCIKPVSLTGLKEKNRIPDLSIFELEPFEMGSLIINFN